MEQRVSLREIHQNLARYSITSGDLRLVREWSTE